MKELLFSVTIADCEVQTFRAGGKGGQHQNKVETGVRIIHPPSGARAEAREMASQLQNKRAAWKRLGQRPEFIRWVKIESARRRGQLTNELLAREFEINPKEIKVEVQNRKGEWVEEE